MAHTTLKDVGSEFGEGSLTTYFVGFVLSLLLTFTAYFLVVDKVFTGGSLDLAIVALGVVQMIVQVIFFLHLGSETKPRWNLFLFIFMLIIIVTVVFGTLWIMNNLNENLMPMSHD